LPIDIGQELPPGGPVCEIEIDPLEPAARLFIGEVNFLQLDHLGVINFDPAERFRQIHPVGSRVEGGAKIENRIDPFADRLLDEVVDNDRPNHQPGAKEGPRQRCQDFLAVIARKPGRERTAEERLAPLGLERAESRHHEGSV
jgi:hypothetical protein